MSWRIISQFSFDKGMDKSVEHSREPRIRCLCMWQIHVQQGGQFNSMKINGLFIKCVGKLIINLGGGEWKQTPCIISCAGKNTHTHTHAQPSKCIRNQKVKPNLTDHQYNLSAKVNFLRLETQKLQNKDIWTKLCKTLNFSVQKEPLTKLRDK